MHAKWSKYIQPTSLTKYYSFSKLPAWKLKFARWQQTNRHWFWLQANTLPSICLPSLNHVKNHVEPVTSVNRFYWTGAFDKLAECDQANKSFVPAIRRSLALGWSLLQWNSDAALKLKTHSQLPANHSQSARTSSSLNNVGSCKFQRIAVAIAI